MGFSFGHTTMMVSSGLTSLPHRRLLTTACDHYCASTSRSPLACQISRCRCPEGTRGLYRPRSVDTTVGQIFPNTGPIQRTRGKDYYTIDFTGTNKGDNGYP